MTYSLVSLPRLHSMTNQLQNKLWCFLGLQFGSFLGIEPWQVYVEGTPFVNLAFYPNAPLIQFDNFTANKQAEACAANGSGARIVDAIKLLK